MLIWLLVISIIAAVAAVVSFLAMRNRWIGPYGLMLETRSSLKSVALAAVLLVAAAPASLNILPLSDRAQAGVGAGLLVAAAYLSALSIFRGRWRRIPAAEIALWCRELGLLVQQNVPILRALDVLAHDSRSYRIYEFTLALREAVRRGEALSDWACLPPLCGYPSEVIRAGEQSGHLGSALIGLADVFERRGRMKIGERLPMAPERPRPEPSEEEMSYIFLHLPGHAREAEKLLSTRLAGVEAAELIGNSPVIRIVNIAIAHAIRQRANRVLLESGEVCIAYGEDDGQRDTMFVLPPFVHDAFARRLKLLADIPYWRKPPATGFVSVSYEGIPYRLVLWVEPDENGTELLRLDIPQNNPLGGTGE